MLVALDRPEAGRAGNEEWRENAPAQAYNQQPYYLNAKLKVRNFATSGNWTDTNCGSNNSALTFGTNGEGAFLHMATEQFRVMAGFEYMHVPYRAMSDVFTQMMGGEIHATMGSFISVQPLADSGKLRLLGIARATRSPDYPNVPTIAETLPGFASGGWFGMIAPAGLPKEIVTTLNKEINWALQQPDVRDRMKKLGLDIHTEAPEYFTELLNRDFAGWSKLIKDIGFKPM